MNEKTLELNELLNYVTEESLPIVLLDWNVIKGIPQKGYLGHFVPVVGYTKDLILIHNPGLIDSEAFMELSFSLFDNARKSKGTDEDVLVIYRK